MPRFNSSLLNLLCSSFDPTVESIELDDYCNKGVSQWWMNTGIVFEKWKCCNIESARAPIQTREGSKETFEIIHLSPKLKTGCTIMNVTVRKPNGKENRNRYLSRFWICQNKGVEWRIGKCESARQQLLEDSSASMRWSNVASSGRSRRIWAGWTLRTGRVQPATIFYSTLRKL